MDNDFNYLDLDPEIEDEPNPSNVDDNPNINLDPVDPPTTVEEPTEEDLITSFLKTKGIKDPTAIKQLDDNGEIQRSCKEGRTCTSRTCIQGRGYGS